MHHYAKLLRRGAFFQKLGKVFNSKNYLFSFLRFTLTAPTNKITSNQKHSVIQSELVRELETQLIELNLSLGKFERSRSFYDKRHDQSSHSLSLCWECHRSQSYNLNRNSNCAFYQIWLFQWIWLILVIHQCPAQLTQISTSAWQCLVLKNQRWEKHWQDLSFSSLSLVLVWELFKFSFDVIL